MTQVPFASDGGAQRGFATGQIRAHVRSDGRVRSMVAMELGAGIERGRHRHRGQLHEVSQAREIAPVASLREDEDTAELFVRRRGQRIGPRHELAKLVDRVRLLVGLHRLVGRPMATEQLAEPVDERIDVVRELFDVRRAVAVIDVADDAGGRRRVSQQLDEQELGDVGRWRHGLSLRRFASDRRHLARA
jgi:hypothetical protein